MSRNVAKPQSDHGRASLTRGGDARFAPDLLCWYRKEQRDLPWRRTTNAYRVWVSEVMLQQTQVATVIPYYARFLKRFPTLRALARAELQDVLKLWEGLGYYSRCRNFHKAARVLVDERAGNVPRTAADWASLPGIGPYTAAALGSIVDGDPVPVVDGNVIRVVARLLCLRTDSKSPALKEEIRRYLQVQIPQDEPGDFNQAMMELGALVCRPTQPTCATCPIRQHCKAYRNGVVEELPVRKRKKPSPHKEVVACVIVRGGKVLITKRPAHKMLGGLWEFPGGKVEAGETLEEAARREIREELDLPITVGRKICMVRHVFSHFTMNLHAFECRPRRGLIKTNGCDEARWVQWADLVNYPFPVADRKIIGHCRALGV